VAHWVGIHWKRLVLSLVVVTVVGLVAFLILTNLGHDFAARSSVAISSVCALSVAAVGIYGQLHGYKPPASIKPEPSQLVVVCLVREDLRWALWLEDRLNACGYVARLHQLPAGEDSTAIATWATHAVDDAACILGLVTPRLLQAGPSALRRLTAIAENSRGRERLVLVSAQSIDGTLDVRARYSISIAGIHQDSEAWLLVQSAIHKRGARSAPRRIVPRGPGGGVPFPGKGVARANLPAANPNFIGRTEELAFLKEHLVDRQGSVTERSVAVHAMSGMGKTQLAIEFVNALDDFDTVWWIHAHQTAAIFEDLTSLAQELGISEVADQREMLRLLWEQLRATSNWLLVYDNAEAEDELRDLVPPGGDGALLITSQSPNWSTLLHGRYELARMSDGDAVALLQRRTAVRDEQVLGQIAEQLGWLPLALEQAASYMRETQCSPSWYMRQLTRRFSETLQSGTQAYYDKSAATTYRLARERTAEIEPLSGLLMELCGFFSPDAIPRTLFEALSQADALPPELAVAMEAGLPYDKAVSAARKFSLLTVTETSFTMHRVVQKLIRDSLTRPVRSNRAASALKLLSSAFPADPDDPREWDECGALQSHCITALTEVAEHDLVSVDSIRLSRLIGEYLRARGAFEPALKRLTTTLAQLRSHPDPQELAAVELALTRVYFRVANLPWARDHGLIALRLHDEAYGSDSPRTAACLLELSRIRMELSEFDEAVDNAGRSLEIYRPAGDAAAAMTGLSLEALGYAQWRLGMWTLAYESLAEAVDLLTYAYGIDNGITARARTGLGLVLRDSALGDRDKLALAAQELRHAHRVLVSAHGADHPDTISAAIHLADTRHRAARARLRANKNRAEYERECKAVAREFDALMARPPMQETSPGRACGLVRHGHLLNSLGSHVHARELVQEARGIYIQKYGADHPYVAEALTRLIGIEYDLKDAPEADRAAQEARRIYVRSYGADHPYVRQIDEFIADPEHSGRD
jgi:tetratricopeptide (TPR) repeat protein